MTLRPTYKIAAIASSLLSLCAAAADVKEHPRTPYEQWDYEITSNAASWTVETYLGTDFSLHVPEVESLCPQKRLQFALHSTGPFERMYNTVMAAKSMNAELIVKFRKAPRQTFEPRCEIHSISMKSASASSSG
ncbi:MAG: hypothetical protein ACTHOL_13550 [Luteibacter jiangsuensis]